MSNPIEKPQTLKNHAKLDPLFHFFLVPVTVALLIWSTVVHFHLKNVESFFVLAAFFLLLVTIFKTRTYALKVQDRVIRVEERMRLSSLCSEGLRGRIPQLSERQLIALRFASDGEAPGLVEKALDEGWSAKQIKAGIQNWRADYFRV